ncbi:MAG: hypothetical protein Q9159_001789, partial [Coniocarpon cinnabarinum]
MNDWQIESLQDTISGIVPGSQRLVENIFACEWSGKRKYDDVAYVVNSMLSRRTTKPEDEPICMAFLLGMDLRKLPERPTLQDVIAERQTVPSALLFTPGPRSSKAGYRWSPQSFLDQKRNVDFSIESKPALQCAQGLEIRADVIKFCDDLVLHSKPYQFAVKDQNDDSLLQIVRVEAGLPSDTSPAPPLTLQRPVLVLSDPGGGPCIFVNVKEGVSEERMYVHYQLAGLAVNPEKNWKTIVDVPAATLRGKYEQQQLL